MAHTCNAYCHGTVHAYTVLVPPEVPEAERAPQFAQILAEKGWQLLAFRAALEADVACVMAHLTFSGYVSQGQAILGSLEGLEAESPKLPYLALVETVPQEGGTP